MVDTAALLCAAGCMTNSCWGRRTANTALLFVEKTYGDECLPSAMGATLDPMEHGYGAQQLQ